MGIRKLISLFSGSIDCSPPQALNELQKRFGSQGLVPYFQIKDGEVVIKLTPIKLTNKRMRVFIPVLLFILTLLSTLFIGTLSASTSLRDILSNPFLLMKGAPFSFTLLIILVFHEFSHYFFSRKYGIRASLPYFIPFPNIFGTMGAIIITRSPFPNRKSLFDVGISGPLASFILSVGAIFLGFSETSLVKTYPHFFRSEPGLYLGDSLLTKWLFWLRYQQIPSGYEISLGPIGFAGWVGLFITALNLLPMSQLDGGHISYSVFGGYHKIISRSVTIFLILLGLICYSPVWIIIGILVLIIGGRHAPPLDDITPLNPSRICLAVIAFIILVICFVPVPIKIMQ